MEEINIAVEEKHQKIFTHATEELEGNPAL